MSKPNHPKNEPLSVQRGNYNNSKLAKTIFVLGRLATGPIQYLIIKNHPLGQIFNIPPPPTGGFIHLLGQNNNNNRTPFLPFLTVLMPTALSLKHTLWITTYSQENMTIPFATFGVLADIIYESITTLVYTTSSINPLFSPRTFKIGTTIYFTGLAIELVAELHRVVVKRSDSSDSKGNSKKKLCTTGLWSVTRHINYTANVIYGFGYGLATGGFVYSVMTAGMYLSNFVGNAIPSIEDYCREKYGEVWDEYVERTPWMLIPGVY